MVTIENVSEKSEKDRDLTLKIKKLAKNQFGGEWELENLGIEILLKYAEGTIQYLKFAIYPSLNFMHVYDQDITKEELEEFGKKYESLKIQKERKLTILRHTPF